MKNENNRVIQKVEKGNTIVILDKDSYLKSVETLLKDSSKFKSIPVAPDKDLNPLSAKFIKWSNTLKQIVGKLPTICLSVFDHFSGLALKGLIMLLILKKRDTDLLKKLKNKNAIGEETYNKLRPVGSKPGTPYG